MEFDKDFENKLADILNCEYADRGELIDSSRVAKAVTAQLRSWAITREISAKNKATRRRFDLLSR